MRRLEGAAQGNIKCSFVASKNIAKQIRFNAETIEDVTFIAEFYHANFSDAVRVSIREWSNVLRQRRAPADGQTDPDVKTVSAEP
jgi:hypothetical protein